MQGDICVAYTGSELVSSCNDGLQCVELLLLPVSGVCTGVLQLINNTPKNTDTRVCQLLNLDELCLYNSTTKPAKLCGSMLSALVSSAGFSVEQEVHLNTLLGQVAANVSMVARIKLQALPYGEHHIAVFVTVIGIVT